MRGGGGGGGRGAYSRGCFFIKMFLMGVVIREGALNRGITVLEKEKNEY